MSLASPLKGESWTIPLFSPVPGSLTGTDGAPREFLRREYVN